MDLRKRLTIYITNIINNPSDFKVDEVVETLTSGNYLICNPNNLSVEQFNWLCMLMEERREVLKSIKLKQTPKQI